MLHCGVPAATKSLVSRLAPIISRRKVSLRNSGSAPTGARDVKSGFQTVLDIPESTVTQVIVET